MLRIFHFSSLPIILFGLTLAACGQGRTDSSVAETDSEGRIFITITENTVLKKRTEDSSHLVMGSEKCNVPKGRLYLSAHPQFEGRHLLVNTAKMLKNCGFSRGYIFADHVSESSSGAGGSRIGGGGTVATEFPAEIRAFLDTIAYAEGTGDVYNYQFTHVKFYSYARHPGLSSLPICSGGLCSDAAGRYQFLSTTWEPLRLRLGLSDFSPANQDRAAVALLKDCGVYNLILNGEYYDSFSRAAYGVATTWASFPGSPYGQPTYSAQTLYSQFMAFLKRY
jgi:muramidase (phage lysozyme)